MRTTTISMIRGLIRDIRDATRGCPDKFSIAISGPIWLINKFPDEETIKGNVAIAIVDTENNDTFVIIPIPHGWHVRSEISELVDIQDYEDNNDIVKLLMEF